MNKSVNNARKGVAGNAPTSKGRVSLPAILAAGVALAMAFTLTSCGPSKAELAIMAMPSIGEVSGLKNKLTWLQGNAQSGGNYVIEIDADEIVRCGFLSSCYELSYKGKSDITITLKGIGANRTIGFTMHPTNGVGGGAGKSVYHSGFTIESGVTLVLDDNITLKGGTQEFALVKVYSGGTLVMNEGSAIIGATNNNNEASSSDPIVYGAGVYVYSDGTFIMKGGTISGNTIQPRQLTVQEVENAKAGYAIGRSLIEGGKKAVEKAEEKFSKINIRVGGAGVYVSGGVANANDDGYAVRSPFSKKPAPSGTFIKTGGTITGYSSDPENGNVIKSTEGEVLNGFGHAVYFDSQTYSKNKETKKAIDTTIGPEITINFKNGVFSEGRNEEAKPQETIAEPEETTIPSDVPAETQTQQNDQDKTGEAP